MTLTAPLGGKRTSAEVIENRAARGKHTSTEVIENRAAALMEPDTDLAALVGAVCGVEATRQVLDSEMLLGSLLRSIICRPALAASVGIYWSPTAILTRRRGRTPSRSTTSG